MSNWFDEKWIKPPSRYQLLKAKLFGHKFVSESEDLRLTWYFYKGHYYLVKQEKIDERT